MHLRILLDGAKYLASNPDKKKICYLIFYKKCFVLSDNNWEDNFNDLLRNYKVITFVFYYPEANSLTDIFFKALKGKMKIYATKKIAMAA